MGEKPHLPMRKSRTRVTCGILLSCHHPCSTACGCAIYRWCPVCRDTANDRPGRSRIGHITHSAIRARESHVSWICGEVLGQFFKDYGKVMPLLSSTAGPTCPLSFILDAE